MRRTFSVLLVVAFMLLPAALFADEGRNTEADAIKVVWEKYIKAIQNSDLETLFTTVADGEDFLFLTSRGEAIKSRDGYYKFHEGWFKEKDWEMPAELVEVHAGKEYGYTVATYNFKSKTREGYEYSAKAYFTLIFHKENGEWKIVSDFITPIETTFHKPGSEVKYNKKQMYFFDIIESRRTVRKFKSDPVPKEHIERILDAARYAPTSGNQQPWKFLVIQDREKLNELEEEALDWYIDKIKNRVDRNKLESIKKNLTGVLDDVLSAPVYVVILVDERAKYQQFIVHDGVLAVENLMLAARALGYGTGYYTTFFPEEELKDFFDIPDHYMVICMTPIGVPDEWPKTPPKRQLNSFIVWESFE